MFSSHQESPSCPPENRPSGTRKKQASFPFHSGNPTTFSSIFNFQFSDSMTSASVSASKPLLPLFHSAIPSKPYKPSLFLIFSFFFILEEEWLVAWNRDACLGSSCKKRSRARRISLKFIWLCFMFFMFFFTRTLGWVLVGREHLLFKLGVSLVVINCICLSFMQIHTDFYFDYIIYSGLLIFCCQNVATLSKTLGQ